MFAASAWGRSCWSLRRAGERADVGPARSAVRLAPAAGEHPVGLRPGAAGPGRRGAGPADGPTGANPQAAALSARRGAPLLAGRSSEPAGSRLSAGGRRVRPGGASPGAEAVLCPALPRSGAPSGRPLGLRTGRVGALRLPRQEIEARVGLDDPCGSATAE